MKLNYFTTIIRAVPQFTSNQINIIQHHINDELQRGGTNVLIDQCKSNAIECPYCGAENVGKWGCASGIQCYECKETSCRKTFNALTKTPLARLKKHNLW